MMAFAKRLHITIRHQGRPQWPSDPRTMAGNCLRRGIEAAAARHNPEQLFALDYSACFGQAILAFGDDARPAMAQVGHLQVTSRSRTGRIDRMDERFNRADERLSHIEERLTGRARPQLDPRMRRRQHPSTRNRSGSTRQS